MPPGQVVFPVQKGLAVYKSEDGNPIFQKTSEGVGYTGILALRQWSLEKFLSNKALLIPFKTCFQLLFSSRSIA